jgi:hypothetical protein
MPPACRGRGARHLEACLLPVCRAAGIGVFTGEVVAEAIGLPSAANYTVVGDSVNVAAWLCAAAPAASSSRGGGPCRWKRLRRGRDPARQRPPRSAIGAPWRASVGAGPR